MQNKGAIRFFAIALALVCLFQLSFTFFTKKTESDARGYANSKKVEQTAKELAKGNEILEKHLLDSLRKAEELFYLDSMKKVVVYNLGIRKYTYQECKERELNLGLDLKGGMNVTLQVSVVDIIKNLSRDANDPTLIKTINRANELQKQSDANYITLFHQAFEEVAPDQKLAGLFNTMDLQDRINFNSSNDEVIDILRIESNKAIDRTFKILSTRIDRFGVAQPNINRIPGTGRIIVELPGVKDHARVRKLLQGTAQLEFWETFELSEILPYLEEANAKLRDLHSGTIVKDTASIADSVEAVMDSVGVAENNAVKDSAETDEANPLADLVDQSNDSSANALAAEKSFEQYAKENPLYAYLQPSLVQDEQGNYFPAQGSNVGFSKSMDTAKVNKMLRDVKSIFPRSLKLRWQHKPFDTENDLFYLVALKIPRDGQPPLDGDAISDARQDIGQNGSAEISMTMNKEGASTWRRLTAENKGKQIAIVLDDVVYTNPRVNEEIPNGRSQITGDFSIEEAKDIANVLEAGKLPAPARIVEEAVVGPSLGQEAINNGFMSFALAFLLILAYMWFYYSKGGMIADISLFANIFFILGVLASLGAVLTLPGIAGIVLTLGMAVDANVIIYERIREEVRAGKGTRLAIADGYKNAYSAIIDGNVTTLLTGVVLYIFGSGPVQGFATTLIIGICTSLFSAIFLSRLFFSRMVEKNRTINFDTKITRNILANAKFDFIKIRKVGYTISSIVIVLGIASLALKGLDLGVDFAGGRTYTVRFDQDVSTVEVSKSLADEFGENVEVKTFGPSTQIKATTKYMIEEKSIEVDSIVERKLFEGVKSHFATPIDYQTFASDSDDGKMVGLMSSQKVDPTISDDLYRAAIFALLFALIIIFIYIALRFNKWQYGLGGLTALIHDSLIAVSLYSIFSGILPFTLEVDQAFIAAILTIIGYSINDSVVIFDRVREFVKLHPKTDLKENVNNALNSTLSRTINTSGTTFVVLLMIFIFGGEVIRGFTFALMVGVLIGTYSSLFNATPVAYDFIRIGQKRQLAKNPKTAKKKGKK